MPNTLHFMTYEGSATYPGCWETVTWILLNKPIYITAQDLFGLRLLMQGDEVNPKAPLARNSRSYFFTFFIFLQKLPPYTLSGFDLTTHSSSLLVAVGDETTRPQRRARAAFFLPCQRSEARTDPVLTIYVQF
jgi:hypothetical protein